MFYRAIVERERESYIDLYKIIMLTKRERESEREFENIVGKVFENSIF